MKTWKLFHCIYCKADRRKKKRWQLLRCKQCGRKMYIVGFLPRREVR